MLYSAPHTSWVQELTVQEDELVGAKWMPLEEYVAMPFTQSR